MFDKFLKTKGLSESQYKEKSTEDIQDLDMEYNKYLSKNISSELERAVKTDELDSLKKEMSEMSKKVMETQKLESSIEALTGEVAKMKEMPTGVSKEGVLSKFFEKNAKSFDNGNKYYSQRITFKAASLMTTANIIPITAGGYSPLFNNYIDNDLGRTPKPDNFILGLVDVRTQLGTESILYSDRVNEEGNAEFIGEGTLKPLADAEWKTSKKSTKEVAIRWKFSQRLMNHAPSVEADFKEHAEELMHQVIDNIALIGEEAVNVNEFDGIATLADPFIVPAELANFYQNANIYDVINSVSTYVRLNNFKGNLTAVLNTVWKAKMQGLKNAQDDYIIPPFVTQDGSTVGEVSVKFQNKMPASNIILGDFKKYKIIVAEDILHDDGYENDDFSKNLVSRKIESFLGSYKKESDAGSIIYDDIDTILTAINEVPVP